MMKYSCPQHTGTLFTPTDTECHAHESNLQQRFHNLHCQLLRCPRALKGDKKYQSVPLIAPRTLIERVLRKIS